MIDDFVPDPRRSAFAARVSPATVLRMARALGRMQGRWAMPVMFGGRADCSAPDRLRQRAETALETRNLGELQGAALEAIAWMNELPPTHPLCPPVHLKVHKHGPVVRGLGNVFLKIADLRHAGYGAKAGATYLGSVPNNAASMALEGACGVGKTTMLRLLTLVPALVFPESVVSVYVDCRQVSRCVPRDLLAEALQATTGQAAQSAPSSLEHVLDAVRASGRVPVFAADEVEAAYLDPVVWSSFHLLATSYDPTLFIAGQKLRGMLELRGHESSLHQQFPDLPAHVPLPHCLNTDKVELVHVQRTTDI